MAALKRSSGRLAMGVFDAARQLFTGLGRTHLLDSASLADMFEW
jgi:hypothetical protein